jgi:hypothetical protein
MKVKKVIFLFLALLLPVFVFLFLKFFGKNEFAVQPLYTEVSPEIQQGCSAVAIPYHVPDSMMRKLTADNDSLVLVWFGKLSLAGNKQYNRIEAFYAKDPVNQLILEDASADEIMKCVFFLKPPFDVVLLDINGTIRGQYKSNDREDIDRLKIEIDIILKKY